MKSLLNKNLVSTMTDLNFTYSHGGDTGYLGGGLFYYALVYTFKYEVCYCLGSGAGFVPICMKQAQRDVGIGSTTLVDANLGSDEYGWPVYHTNQPTTLTTKYSDINIIKSTSLELATEYLEKGHGRFIDYMHIDANHSYESVKEDFILWSHFIKPGGFISLHDSLYHSSDFGVDRFVVELTSHIHTYHDMEIINFPFGDGTALVKFVD